MANPKVSNRKRPEPIQKQPGQMNPQEILRDTR